MDSPWYKKCANDIDYFTQERLADINLAEEDSVKIHYDEIGKIECFNPSTLTKFFMDTKPVVMWEKMEDFGLPLPVKNSINFYKNPGQFGGYFTENVVDKIMEGMDFDIHVIKYPKDVMMGTIDPTFGVSELHGQDVTVYYDRSEMKTQTFFARHLVGTLIAIDDDREITGSQCFNKIDESLECVDVKIVGNLVMILKIDFMVYAEFLVAFRM